MKNNKSTSKVLGQVFSGLWTIIVWCAIIIYWYFRIGFWLAFWVIGLSIGIIGLLTGQSIQIPEPPRRPRPTSHRTARH